MLNSISHTLFSPILSHITLSINLLALLILSSDSLTLIGKGVLRKSIDSGLGAPKIAGNVLREGWWSD